MVALFTTMPTRSTSPTSTGMHAPRGTGIDHVEDLHRIEPEIVKRKVIAAGFELEATSDLLRHRADDRTSNVFDEEIRGKTDRFIFRFRKPD